MHCHDTMGKPFSFSAIFFLSRTICIALQSPQLKCSAIQARQKSGYWFALSHGNSEELLLCYSGKLCVPGKWRQRNPHAVPSALRAKRPKPSHKTHGPTLSLERAGQNQDHIEPTW
ncbi:hypothetical protein V6N12_056788 [Hibiscus sabdariffa]|uniref:Secreted protein n=1 Tax=Hibiscus sabdariffa TaxID=183260 RepID=A0ABR2DC33_9ROSI